MLPPKPKLNLIVAVSENMGIGKNGELPWRLKAELKHFATITKSTQSPEKKNAVLMGRKTWESIPTKFRPLKDRVNIVLTSNPNLISDESVCVCPNFNTALDLLDNMSDEIETCWVIGGSSIYAEALKLAQLDSLYITRIHKDYDCDTFFPVISSDWKLSTDPRLSPEIQEEEGVKYEYQVYTR
uniref:dihydrofolate reductase n=1 Tax=Acartia pacifica TaxID=335913 RepID=A0A0U2URU6_ACAPC|nr:dihydrofolate reductase [Acartia pacifica]